jgi:hypothetical protein
MDNGPGWLPDPEDEAQERYWSGSAWTDRVRPAGRARSLHLPEHVPDLQRALAASTADIDAVEDRLSTMFERTDGAAPPSAARMPPVRGHEGKHDDADPDADFRDVDAEAAEGQIESEDEADTTPIHSEFADPSEDDGDDEAFAELNAALAAEEPDETVGPEKPKRGLFRRRS